MESFIITFRETFEAALITGIIFSYLNRTSQRGYYALVYWGIAAAVAACLLSAFTLQLVASGFSGRAEEIFEGITMYITVGFLVFMIMWCVRHKHRVSELEEEVSSQLDDGRKWGLFLLVFIAVLREGLETVFFLNGIAIAGGGFGIGMALLGITAAVAVGYGFFKGMVRINLKVFFNVTTLLLILFAGGLLAHGTHEMQEAGIIPAVLDHVWDINPSNPSHFFHEKGIIGSFLVALFGYNGNPSLPEAVSYFLFLFLSFGWWYSIERRHMLQAVGSRQ